MHEPCTCTTTALHPSHSVINKGGGATLTPGHGADKREDDPDETAEDTAPFSEESEQWFAQHLAKAPPISEEQARHTIRIIALATSSNKLSSSLRRGYLPDVPNLPKIKAPTLDPSSSGH
jgi:hypothetical protein